MYYSNAQVEEPEIEILPEIEAPTETTPNEDPYDVPVPHPDAEPEPKA